MKKIAYVLGTEDFYSRKRAKLDDEAVTASKRIDKFHGWLATQTEALDAAAAAHAHVAAAVAAAAAADGSGMDAPEPMVVA